MTSVQDWLKKFGSAASAGNGEAISALFSPDGLWRDYLTFGWTLQTIEGRSTISTFASVNTSSVGFVQPVFEGQSDDTEGFFRFQTALGNGRGYIRLQNGQCTTLFTMLDDLANVAPLDDTKNDGAAGPADNFVLIIGGGQGGLALGAQLSACGVPYLIVDKHPRVGDQWRSRYDSLVLHDPVWYDHLPFVPFPEDWPVFTPKDMMGDWLEAYAERLSLSIWTSTEMTAAAYDDDGGFWRATVRKDDETIELSSRHLVFALGNSGFPKVPEFDGQSKFCGQQFHSSAYQGGSEFAGQNVVVIGANNSAHDIAADLVDHGAKPVMIQRSSTLVARQSDYCEKVLGPHYSAEAVAAGITTEKADILSASVPIRLLEKQHRPLWDQIKIDQSDYYHRLTAAGFRIDFAEDGAGLGLKYRRTASGYYIDVGAAEMVADGRIAVRSGRSVKRLSSSGLELDCGEDLPADAVIYATGFGTMSDWVSELINPETAARVGACWGYGSGTKGDPGPWIGELRNMWMPTAQSGLWFMGGNLAQTRFYSRCLALQLQGRYLQVSPHIG